MVRRRTGFAHRLYSLSLLLLHTYCLVFVRGCLTLCLVARREMALSSVQSFTNLVFFPRRPSCVLWASGGSRSVARSSMSLILSPGDYRRVSLRARSCTGQQFSTVTILKDRTPAPETSSDSDSSTTRERPNLGKSPGKMTKGAA